LDQKYNFCAKNTTFYQKNGKISLLMGKFLSKLCLFTKNEPHFVKRCNFLDIFVQKGQLFSHFCKKIIILQLNLFKMLLKMQKLHTEWENFNQNGKIFPSFDHF